MNMATTSDVVGNMRIGHQGALVHPWSVLFSNWGYRYPHGDLVYRIASRVRMHHTIK